MFGHQPINRVQGSMLGTGKTALNKGGMPLPFWSLAGTHQILMYRKTTGQRTTTQQQQKNKPLDLRMGKELE